MSRHVVVRGKQNMGPNFVRQAFSYICIYLGFILYVVNTVPSCRREGEQNVGAPNFVRQAYLLQISIFITCQDCSVSREAHGVRLDASIN